MPENINLKSNVVFNEDKNKEASHVAVSENSEFYEEKSISKKKPFIMIKLLRSVINFFFDFLETIVVALSVFVVVYLFIIQPHEVKGSSMEPSFQNNEYIITDKLSYRFGNPQRGDVVIFKAPINPDVDYIKRIIGLPGEKVKISQSKVYIDDKLLDEPYLEEITPLFPGGFVQEGITIDIPIDHYFVMGDNRPHSSDSREFGPIPRKSIVGKAIFRYWTINELGLIQGVNYQFL